MYNGTLIQDLDIADVSSERRDPILANVMYNWTIWRSEAVDFCVSVKRQRLWTGIEMNCNPYSNLLQPSFRLLSSLPPIYRMAETLSVSQRTIERDLSAMQNMGILKHAGKDNNGVWVIGS